MAKPRRGAETEMRDTIDWLLALPEGTRRDLSVAEQTHFTLEDPAPPVASLAAASAMASPAFMGTVDLTSVQAAERAAAGGKQVCLLNFANAYNCGGGFEHKRGTQEEDIFRQTSCFLSLWPRRREDDGPGVLNRGLWIGNYDASFPRADSSMYPMTECGTIYTPEVIAVRDQRVESDTEPNPLLEISAAGSAPRFALISAAAQDVSKAWPFNPELLKQKLRSVLWVAADHDKDCLVLGAFGCGAFMNPPHEVVKIFAGLLQGDTAEFAGIFREVIFAVPKKFGLKNFDAFATRFPESTYP